METGLKSVKISEDVHTTLKTFLAKNKIKNITSFVDGAILQRIEAVKIIMKGKTNAGK